MNTIQITDINGVNTEVEVRTATQVGYFDDGKSPHTSLWMYRHVDDANWFMIPIAYDRTSQEMIYMHEVGLEDPLFDIALSNAEIYWKTNRANNDPKFIRTHGIMAGIRQE